MSARDHYLRDQNLTLADKGLLSALLAFVDEEIEPFQTMIKCTADDAAVIRESIEHLIEHGYMSLETIWILGKQQSELTFRPSPRKERPSP
ncbi:MAG: hypothetical protein RRY64_07070 [Oscillospiraceae bacterium]